MLGSSQVIRNEFEEEINERKISFVEYIDTKGEKRPMFELTLDQAQQVLTRESKAVRRAVIKKLKEQKQKIQELENKTQVSNLQNPIQIIEFALNELKNKEAKIQALTSELEYKEEIILDIASNVPPKTMRSTINQIVRNYSKDYHKTWITLYKEFKYLHHKDLPLLYENAIKRCELGKNKNILDYAEKFDYLTKLYELALKLFEANKKVLILA